MLPFRKLYQSFVSLMYPPLCLYCSASLTEDSQIFCCACLELLQFIDPSERCPYCFSIDYSLEEYLCQNCLHRIPILNAIAATFDYAGPAACLVRSIKYANLPFLAKGAGAYMVAQFLRLEWPMPDYVVPVPMALNHKLERGYNQSLLLAATVAEILDRPVLDVLHRKSGDYSQAGLNRRQRMNLKGNTIFLKKGINLAEKCILLIDDVMTTGSTLRACGEVLIERGLLSIYGLTVCRAIK